MGSKYNDQQKEDEEDMIEGNLLPYILIQFYLTFIEDHHKRPDLDFQSVKHSSRIASRGGGDDLVSNGTIHSMFSHGHHG